MVADVLKRLIVDEAGSSVAELALFAGMAILTGIGFISFSAGQFQEAVFNRAPVAGY